jgi:Uma2 family endonuclease
MSTVASPPRYTPEDLLRMPDGDRYELVDGQLVERTMSYWSSYVAGRLHRLMGNFAETNRLGWVAPEGATFQCFPGTPDKVRRPDVSFIRLERLSIDRAMAEGHNHVAPDIAVEVISPNDLAYEVDAKVEEFLEAGARLIWVVNPETRTVEVHRSQGQGTILREQDELTGEDVLSGFRCRVADLFLPPAGVAAAP